MALYTEQQLIDRIRDLCPCRDDAQARSVLGATLEVLGEQLFDEERAFIGRELPPGVAELLVGAKRHSRSRSVEHFFRRVAERERSRIGLGVEHAEVVCRVLAGCLSEATLQRLRGEAPELAELFFSEHERVPEPPSEGEPRGPLEAAGSLPRPHTHSIAASEDPHAETRLSSAHGLTQEREGHTLAAGRPGSSRPLSEGRR